MKIAKGKQANIIDFKKKFLLNIWCSNWFDYWFPLLMKQSMEMNCVDISDTGFIYLKKSFNNCYHSRLNDEIKDSNYKWFINILMKTGILLCFCVEFSKFDRINNISMNISNIKSPSNLNAFLAFTTHIVATNARKASITICT